MRKHIANVITIVRILLSFVLLTISPLSATFYIVYFLCGCSDVLDGILARRLQIRSKLGAVLDSIADLVFMIIVLVCLLPVLIEILPYWVWIGIAVVALIKIASYVIGFFKFRKWVSYHTFANKAAGGMLFLSVFLLTFVRIDVLSILMLIVSGYAAVEELIINMKISYYHPDITSFMRL